MLTYSFTNIGSDSLYQHLYKCIKNDIIQQILVPGTKLPSKRTFAKNLGISIITVENAYAQLQAEGYIYSIPKKGYFVSDIKNMHPRQAPILSSENVQLSAGVSHYLADFSSNQTSSDNFPFSIWAKLIREILNDYQQELVTNPPCGGILPLRKAIAKYLREFRNICVEPEQIIIGAGTEYLYGLLIQLLGFDKKYAVEDPGYGKIYRIYQKHNVTCDLIPMDHFGMTIDELEQKKSDIIHISPSHHFPTGIVMPISRRYELLAWASKSDSRYIIEDDYDSEFRMTGKPIPSMLNIDVQEKVIYINTFTKTLASTVRISYMVLPKHLVNQFYTELSFYSCTVSNFEQYTLARFIEDGYFEKHINRMRNYYHAKRDLLLKALQNSRLAPYVKIMEEDAGLHFILGIRTGLSDRTFCLLAEQNGVRITALSSFYAQPPQDAEHFFVINYSSIPEDSINPAIEIIYDIITKVSPET
ncbi:MAG: PLP-dependent aminotransferase family protein [Lachnospiraceae bacterium]|nr:PLP-dependent aminotransferase family protein [Lachnospiraceae bacterium]